MTVVIDLTARRGDRLATPHPRHQRIQRGTSRRLRIGGRLVRFRPTRIATEGGVRERTERRAGGGIDRSPLSAEERERGLHALAELEALQAEMLAERDGRPFSPPNWQLIDEARDERTRQLG